MKNMTINTLMTDIFVNENGTLPAPDCIMSQVLTRAIGVMHMTPKSFVDSVVKTCASLDVNLFAYVTFPALYEFFTTAETIEFAAKFIGELRNSGSDKLFEPILSSFLLSNYVFLDALWTNVHARTCGRKKMSMDKIKTELFAAVAECSPLLPEVCVNMIRDSITEKAEICCAAMRTVLFMSFEQFYEFSDDGMTFACGSGFRLFFDDAKDFYSGSMMSILSNMLSGDARIICTPSYTSIPGLTRESLCLCQGDIKMFVRAFIHIPEELMVGKELRTTVKGSKFAPIFMDFFPNERYADTDLQERLFVMNGIPDTTFSFNPIFERAILAGVEVNHERFMEYKHKRMIIDYQRNLRELDVIMSAMMTQRLALTMQGSIQRARDCVFGWMARRCLLSDARSRNPITVEEDVAHFLGCCSPGDSISRPFFVERLNATVISDLTTELIGEFSKACEPYCERPWDDFIGYAGMPFLVKVVPKPGLRPVTGLGNLFRMMTRVFWELEMISARFGRQKETIELMRLVFLASRFTEVVRAYTFFGNVVFDSEFLLEFMGDETVSGWNVFFRMVLGMIQADPVMLEHVVGLDVTK